MKHVPSVMLILLIMGLASSPALAKRGAPKDVPPLTHQGIVYSAPHDQMGYVLATGEKEKRELWKKQIYIVKYDPNLEKDVQDCFITELKLDGGKLIIVNESNAKFELDLATQIVKAK